MGPTGGCWAGARGHHELPSNGRLEFPVAPEWWETDRRVDGATHTVFCRQGPIVYCVEGIDSPDTDLHDLFVDASQAPGVAFSKSVGDRTLDLHHPVASPELAAFEDLMMVPYHSWANRGLSTMRIRFPRGEPGR